MTTTEPVRLGGAEERARLLRLRSPLTDVERTSLGELVTVRPVGGGDYVLSPRRTRAGALAVRDVVVQVAPSVPVVAVFGMFLASEGLSAAVRPEVLAIAADTTLPSVELLLAEAMRIEAKVVAARHIDQAYVRRRERPRSVVGRPEWWTAATGGGRPPVCVHHQKSTDTAVNRAVLGGVVEADRIARMWRFRTREFTEARFAWSSLAERPALRASDVAVARLSVNRMTAHYGPALAIAEILLRHRAVDPLGRGSTETAGWVVDVASLFERYVAWALAVRLEGTGIEVLEQRTDGSALVDGAGRTYRRTRPDVLLRRDEVTLAVVDAKFKPRYVHAEGTGGRVTSEDLYQLLFYQRRHASAAGRPPALIVAPEVVGRARRPAEDQEVTWRDDSGSTEGTVQVLALPLPNGAAAMVDAAWFPDGLV